MTDLPTSTYTWKLDTTTAQHGIHSKEGKYFESPLFTMVGFKWNLRFTPIYKDTQNVMLSVRLYALPTEISKIILLRKFQLLETNTTCRPTEITVAKGHTINGWSRSTLKSEAIQNITRFTIIMQLTLLDVLDSNGKNITEQYINSPEQKLQAPVSINENKYEEYEVRLNSLTTQMDQVMKNMTRIENTLKDIQLQMNEEQKNDNKDWKKEMEEIKKNMKLLLSNNKNNNNEMDKEKQEFKNWIETKLKLPQYYDLFIENGIETLSVVQLMTKDELNEMGITKIGHKMQLLKEIKKLQPSVNQPKEGTAYI